MTSDLFKRVTWSRQCVLLIYEINKCFLGLLSVIDLFSMYIY